MVRLTILALLICSLVHAQDTATVKKKKPTFIHREDIVILNFTSDNWTDLPPGIEAKPLRSRGFSFLFMSERMNKSGNAGVAAGLGFMSQNVHTNAYIADTGSASYLSPVPDSLDLDLNKLSSNYITAALELRLRSNENSRRNRFKLSAGILAGILVQSHIKYEDMNGKIKTYNIAHLNNFQYGIQARLGYNNIALNGYYSLVPVFEDGKGPEMTPYSIGISLTL